MTEVFYGEGCAGGVYPFFRLLVTFNHQVRWLYEGSLN